MAKHFLYSKKKIDSLSMGFLGTVWLNGADGNRESQASEGTNFGGVKA